MAHLNVLFYECCFILKQNELLTRLQQTENWTNLVHSGHRIFIGSNAGTPHYLMEELIAKRTDLDDVEVCQILTLGDAPWAQPKAAKQFKVNTFFIGGEDIRVAVDEGRADYTPCFLSEIHTLFQNDTLPLDVALIMVSPPDEMGFCSLGVSVDITLDAALAAKCVIAQVNQHMPKTAGQSFIHIDQIDVLVESDRLLPEITRTIQTKIVKRIGQYTALLIENRSTLQLGIGAIPDAVLTALEQHKDLGIHSEMISDGVIDLIEAGVITNRFKPIHTGKTITTFCMGSQRVYDFVHNNFHIAFYPASYVNNPSLIAKHDNMISINSAIEVDLTGQVVSDSIGHDFYSGIGGQMDFVTGATMSSGGKSIIAMPSTAKDGTISRIKAMLTQGAGVVTSRGHVDYVVTEFGIASLKGKSIRERSLELIRVAHPKFRATLLEQVRCHYWVPDYQALTPTEVPELGDIQLQRITRDGQQYILRPLNPADERHLQEFFYSHSKMTREMRYNHDPKHMSREKSCDLVSIDQSSDLALCIVKQEGSSIRIHAVGRFYYYQQSHTAEVAFVTRESSQGMGMASILLEKMITIAKVRGLKGLFALVKSQNKAMINVFKQHGFTVLPGEDMQEKEMSLSFVPLQPSSASSIEGTTS